MKKAYKMLSLILLAALIFSACGNVNASETSNKNKYDTIEKVLTEYFNQRANQFMSTEQGELAFVSDEINQSLLARHTAVQTFKTAINSEVIRIDPSYTVQSEDISGDLILVRATDWNDIMYRENGQEEAARMGFGTEHDLTLRLEKGNYILEKDYFDERPILNAYSENPEKETVSGNGEDIVNTQSIRSILDTYFQARANQFFEPDCKPFPFASESVNAVYLERAEAVRQVNRSTGWEIVENKCTYRITSETLEEDVYIIKATDLNEITYKEKGYSGSNYCSFGIDHTFRIRLTDSSYVMEEDVYDERPVVNSYYGEARREWGGPLAVPDNDTDRASVEKIFDAYFRERSNQFTNYHCDALPYVSDSVNAVFFNRFHEMRNFREQLAGVITSVNTTYSINSVEEKDDLFEYEVWEWNDICFFNESTGENETKSFGALHTLKLSCKDGSYSIEGDEYDEQPSLHSAGTVTVNSDRIISSYNPLLAVDYAHTWANGFNLADYSQHAADCANFVSQCLHEGGVAYTGFYPDYSTTWYKDSLPWIQVAAFDSYWRNAGGLNRYYVFPSNWKKVGIGNPVYYLNSSGAYTGHLMICTGFANNGTPLYSAHSPAAYDVPLTGITGVQLYTIEFAHSYSYADTGDEYQHKRTCTVCNEVSYENHTWIPTHLYPESHAESSEDENDGSRYIPAYKCSKCGRITLTLP